VAVVEKQLTFAPHGHILTNVGVWSPDGRWIVYDVRTDPAGSVFDGTRIERVDVATGRVEVLYGSRHGASCGVVTYSPTDDRVVFIHGPEHPTPEWQYAAHHRRGVIVNADRPGAPVNLDACDLTPPFTPGALRGGTHVHTFSADGQWVAFTYEDHVLAQLDPECADHDHNQRNVGVSAPLGPVTVPKTHPRNHAGSHFSVLVTRTVNRPRPGSDEIARAFEDAWVGTSGYLRPDGQRQRRAIAFQGEVVTERGDRIHEVFVVDIPDDVTVPSDAGPIAGTSIRRPMPPRGTIQRRLTYTCNRKYAGLKGPRHWLRSSPDGSHIAFLMRDDAGVVQLWTVSPNGGDPEPVTHGGHDIASAFTWSPDGRRIAHVMDTSICVTNVASGETIRLTPRVADEKAPRPEACVFAPDGGAIALVRPAPSGARVFSQICVVNLE
jgi:WD40 repeat protein